MKSLLESIRQLGFQALSAVQRLGQFLFFCGQLFIAMVQPPWRWRRLVEETWLLGVLSLLVVSISGLAVGMVLGLQGYNTLVRFGAEGALGTVVGLSLIRELGPVLTGLLVTGRAGSATAAGIASMVTTEQLDGLRMMSINPLQSVVAPKALGMILMMPILTAIFVLFGLAGGYFVGVELMGMDPGAFLSGLQDSIRFADDIGACYVKALLDVSRLYRHTKRRGRQPCDNVDGRLHLGRHSDQRLFRDGLMGIRDMMTRSPARDLIAGLFVIFGMIAVATLAFRVGQDPFAEKGGLVLFATLDEDYRARVRMELDGSLELPTDTSASIVTAGVLGDRYISLQLGGEDLILTSGEEISFTESAVILERLIGKVLDNVGAPN
jgi:phospholipid/cholesterol/gamma-HCH transport system permease protein